MNWLSITQTIFDIFWLTAVIILLWRIYIASEQRLKHVRVLEETMLEISGKSAENAQKAVKTTETVVEMLKEEFLELRKIHK